MAKKRKSSSGGDPMEVIRRLLENPLPWPQELRTDILYERLHDDHDGSRQGVLKVGFLSNGDGVIETENPLLQILRFRNSFGGSRSPRTYTALQILALAMKWDAEQLPDDPAEPETE